MDIERLIPFLAWCLAINYAVLAIWMLMLVCARDWMYRTHGRWFTLSGTAFDAMHYGAMSVYKIGILLFNLVPLLAVLAIR